MPCDRVYITTVNLEVADRDLLVKALEALGWQPRLAGEVITFRANRRNGRLERGRFTYAGTTAEAEALATQLRQAYSAQCINAAAQKYGFTVTHKSASQVVLARRR
jgi:hypothetical protein